MSETTKKAKFEAALVRKHLQMLEEHLRHLELALAADCDGGEYGDDPTLAGPADYDGNE